MVFSETVSIVRNNIKYHKYIRVISCIIVYPDSTEDEQVLDSDEDLRNQPRWPGSWGFLALPHITSYRQGRLL